LEKKFEGATCVILVSSPFVSLDIFKVTGLATASEEVRSFTVLWSGAYFNCSSTVKECFVLKYRKPGNIYLLEMALHLI